MPFDIHLGNDLVFGLMPPFHLFLGQDKIEGTEVEPASHTRRLKELAKPRTVYLPAIAEDRFSLDEFIQIVGDFFDRSSVCFEDIAGNAVDALGPFVPKGPVILGQHQVAQCLARLQGATPISIG